MISECHPELNNFMSEWLKSLTDTMVDVGITPKSEIKRVKAMKKLWKSDSFQRLKYILKEPPIQESRARPPEIPLKEDQDDDIESDASARESGDEVMLRAKIEYTTRKEELVEHYQKCLLSDLTKLQQKTQGITASLLEKATRQIEATETGHMEKALENTINDMKMKIKCFKKVKKRQLKMEVEMDRKKVTEQLTNYMKEDIERRNSINEQLLVKKLNFEIQNAKRIIADEFDQKYRRFIMTLTRRLECKKNKMIAKQEKNLKDLELKLKASYEERLKSSENRIQTEINQRKQNLAELNSEELEAKCYIPSASKLREELYNQGWNLGTTNKDLTNLACRLIYYYQSLIDCTAAEILGQCNNYLISFESLRRQKDNIKQCFLKKQPNRIVWRALLDSERSDKNRALLTTSSSLSCFDGNFFSDVLDCDKDNSMETTSSQREQMSLLNREFGCELYETKHYHKTDGDDQKIKFDLTVTDLTQRREFVKDIFQKKLNNVFFLNMT